jgi:hypothetical protein
VSAAQAKKAAPAVTPVDRCAKHERYQLDRPSDDDCLNLHCSIRAKRPAVKRRRPAHTIRARVRRNTPVRKFEVRGPGATTEDAPALILTGALDLPPIAWAGEGGMAEWAAEQAALGSSTGELLSRCGSYSTITEIALNGDPSTT